MSKNEFELNVDLNKRFPKIPNDSKVIDEIASKIRNSTVDEEKVIGELFKNEKLMVMSV